MNKNKIGILATVMVIGIVAIAIGSMTSVPSPSMDEAEFTNYVTVHKNDILVAVGPNQVTHIGLNHTRDALMGRITTGISANVSVLNLSTGVTGPAITDTDCEDGSEVTGNGLDPIDGTIAEVTTHTGNYSVQKQWTATGTQADIAKVCIGNGTNIFGSSLLSSTVNVESGDTLTVTYYIDLS